VGADRAARGGHGGNRAPRAALRAAPDDLAGRLAGQRVGCDALRRLGRRHGCLPRFARAVCRRQWTEGADIADRDVLAAAAVEAGLDGAGMLGAIQAPELKEHLRGVTERAWEAGVRGVPTLRVGEELFFGDDRLEEAAATMA
jgi:2-hydroxychromene-2-carboxylate isomerase